MKDADMTNPQYFVGEVSNLVGAHPQTVRYFDSIGVAKPVKSKDTGRRRYSVYDIYKITLRSQYKNMGFSPLETENILKQGSIENMLSKVKRKEEDLKLEKQKLELRQAGMSNLMERLERIEPCLNRFLYMKKPAMWRHVHIKEGEFADDKDSIDARVLGAKSMPLCVYSFHFDYGDIQKDPEGNQYRWDLAIPAPYAEEVGFDKIPGTYFEPEKMCLYTVFQIEGTETVRWSMISHRLEPFMEINRLELCGDVEGTIIVNMYDEQDCQKRFFETWIPVRDKESIQQL